MKMLFKQWILGAVFSCAGVAGVALFLFIVYWLGRLMLWLILPTPVLH
jgi:hypothetical protein